MVELTKEKEDVLLPKSREKDGRACGIVDSKNHDTNEVPQ